MSEKKFGQEIFNESECLSLDTLYLYIDEQLSSSKTRAVEAHLIDCELCSEAIKGLATLTVSNLLGQEIKTLFSGDADPGRVYTIQFDAINLANGMYFYKLVSNDQSSIRKMVLLK